MFHYKIALVFPSYVLDQTFEDSRDLLLLINDDKSHYVYIKNFYRFMFHKIKNGFTEVVYNVLVAKNIKKIVLIKHKENCLSVNGQ